jgi:peptidoglycan-associated lipoprotein
MMQPSKILKALAIAIPVLTLTACGSTDSVEETESTNQQTTATTDSTANQGSDVSVGALEREEDLKVKETQRKLEALRQSTVINFAFDQSRIDGKYFQVLEAHAAYLRENPAVTVVVEGHCDERGTPEYNIALGERRAKSVQRYLENLGVSSEQIKTVSYGEEKALDRSRTEAAFAANRRAVLVY